MADIVQTAPSLPRIPLARRPGARFWRGHLMGSEYAWAVAFCVPYIAIVLTLVAYPIGYGIWMGSDPRLYRTLFADPLYVRAATNTVIYVGLTINVKMLLALALSGFFMRRGWWPKAMLMIFVLPWALPSWPAFMSIHWMLNGEWGLINNFLWNVFGINGPHWLTEDWLAFGAVMLSHLWKYLPFSTVILLAGRMAIPTDIIEAARVDGATGWRMFLHVTFPMIGNLYLIATLLSTIFTLGDFNTVTFVSGGGPANATHVLATLSIRYMNELFQPRLGVATALSALPVMVPLVVILMRRLRTLSVQQ
ncbi:MAG TPA: sugar ABC transporter permease [Stellaceae bacterium]|nr:sugar ABC transporter permease [Stellaceae bacterium]